MVRVGKRPVGHFLFEKRAVWNQDFDAVECPEPRAAAAEMGDFSQARTHLDNISHFNLALEDQDEPADEIVHQILRPKPEPDGQRAAEKGKDGQRDFQPVQRGQHKNGNRRKKEDFLLKLSVN